MTTLASTEMATTRDLIYGLAVISACTLTLWFTDATASLLAWQQAVLRWAFAGMTATVLVALLASMLHE